MKFQCEFRHDRSILRPRFPCRLRNFGDLATFTIDFCTLYAKSLSYFYFQFVWSTDLESIPHVSTSTAIISTQFEVDMTIHCRVITFLLLIRYVTSWPWPLTLNSFHTWRVTWPTLSPSLKTLLLFLSYNVFHYLPLKCVRGHCAFAESRDLWVWGQKNYIFLIADPCLPIDGVNLLYMTLWLWPLTFWPWTVVIHGSSCDQPFH